MSTAEHHSLLRAHAEDFAAVALANIEREYPNLLLHLMTGPDDRPRPREQHPAFYGSLDWHSCVLMHWLLVRLLRVAPDAVPEAAIRTALNTHLAAEPLAAEAAYFADPAHRMFERPYGWGWALMLAHEVDALAGEPADDPDAARWSANLRPLADVLVARYLEYLPLVTYPTRYGVHVNSAFGVLMALPYATARAKGSGDGALLAALTEAAMRWFADDTDYPGGWEPAGVDFLSPALTEAALMAALLPAERFPAWLSTFLPDLAEQKPGALFTPAVVSDDSDGHIAHLHGLNISRAWCWNRIAAALPDGDPRLAGIRATAELHAAASLEKATGSDYMVEHWLAAYAVLLLT